MLEGLIAIFELLGLGMVSFFIVTEIEYLDSHPRTRALQRHHRWRLHCGRLSASDEQ